MYNGARENLILLKGICQANNVRKWNETSLFVNSIKLKRINFWDIHSILYIIETLTEFLTY